MKNSDHICSEHRNDFKSKENQKKKILIISHFSDGAERGGNDRFNYLARMLSEEFRVELLTSSFFHTTKKQHSPVEEGAFPYRITYVSEPGYQKNVSLRRFHSHFVFGKNVAKYLSASDRPDLIYCAIPSIDVAGAACRYAQSAGVPFLLDIQDLWPEAFKMVFRIPVLSDILLAPMQYTVNRIYRNSNDIFAVSETYCERGLLNNKMGAKGHAVFLGTDMMSFDQMSQSGSAHAFSDEEFRIVYAGTLGHSYNIKIVLDAMSILQKRGYENIRFIIMGDGPLKEVFEKYAADNHVNADFLGRLPYGDMVKNLTAGHVAVNPIQSGSAASIINKHGDYAMAGLPVVSTQESPEYRHLLKSYEAGFYCNNTDAGTMANIIENLYLDKDLRNRMAENSRKLGAEKFDRRKAYHVIVDTIKSFLDDNQLKIPQ